MKKGLLIAFDAHNHLYRDWHAAQGVTNGAIQNFMNRIMLMTVRYQPEIVVAAFDEPAPVFRQLCVPSYKANRPPINYDLKRQLRVARDLLQYAGVPCLAAESYEADDVLATIAERSRGIYDKIVICSNDKDCEQLLEKGRVSIAKTIRQLGQGDEAQPEIDWLTEDLLKTNKGLRPDQVVDYLCLCGDSADNIKGATGVGPKTARQILDWFDSVDKIDVNDERLSLHRQETLCEFLERYAEIKKLITLVRDVPLVWDPMTADRKAFLKLSRALEIEWNHIAPEIFWQSRGKMGRLYRPSETCKHCPGSSFTDVVAAGRGAAVRRCNACGRDVDCYASNSTVEFYG